MILSDQAIRNAMRWRGLVIDPFDPARLQPASYDLTLAPEILRDGLARSLPLTFRRGDTFLGSTAERVAIPPTLAGRLEGKSTWARRFLFVHAAGFIDPGFEGALTLEFVYHGRAPLTLWPGEEICQLAIFDVLGDVQRPYGTAGNHYQHQSGPTPAWEER